MQSSLRALRAAPRTACTEHAVHSRRALWGRPAPQCNAGRGAAWHTCMHACARTSARRSRRTGGRPGGCGGFGFRPHDAGPASRIAHRPVRRAACSVRRERRLAPCTLRLVLAPDRSVSWSRGRGRGRGHEVTGPRGAVHTCFAAILGTECDARDSDSTQHGLALNSLATTRAREGAVRPQATGHRPSKFRSPGHPGPGRLAARVCCGGSARACMPCAGPAPCSADIKLAPAT